MKRFVRQMSSREAALIIGFGITYGVAMWFALHAIGY